MPALQRLWRNILPLLRNRSFVSLWTAQAVALIAQNMLNYLVIVLVEELTGSSTQTGLAIISFIVPGILFAPIAGVVVDHTNKLDVLVTTTILRAVATALYFVYLLHGRWPIGYIVLLIDLSTFFRTTVNQFFWSAESAAIPMLVEKEQRFTVNAMIGISTNVFNVLGFIILGPFLLKLVGVQVVLWTIILLYLGAAGIKWTIPRDATNGTTMNFRQEGLLLQIREGWQIMLHELRESWQFILRDRAITIAIAYSAVIQTLSLIIGTLAPGFVTRVLGLRAEDAIVVILPAGLGMLAGFFIVGWAARRAGRQRVVNLSMIATGISLLGLGSVSLIQQLAGLPPILSLSLSQPVLLISVIWCLLLGITSSFISVPTQTLLQDRTPEEAYGRVFANRLLIVNVVGIAPIALSGVMADLVGIEWVMGTVGLITLAVAVTGLLYLRRSERLA